MEVAYQKGQFSLRPRDQNTNQFSSQYQLESLAAASSQQLQVSQSTTVLPNLELSQIPQIHKFAYPRGLKTYKRENSQASLGGAEDS